MPRKRSAHVEDAGDGPTVGRSVPYGGEEHIIGAPSLDQLGALMRWGITVRGRMGRATRAIPRPLPIPEDVNGSQRIEYDAAMAEYEEQMAAARLLAICEPATLTVPLSIALNRDEEWVRENWDMRDGLGVANAVMAEWGLDAVLGLFTAVARRVSR